MNTLQGAQQYAQDATNRREDSSLIPPTPLARQVQDRRAHQRYYLYNAILLPLLPAVFLYTLWRRYGQGKSAASLRGQWGQVPDSVVKALSKASGPRLWIHAVSVGETMAARPVARALRAAMPDALIAQSVTTDTGYETAQAALRAGEVDTVFYFPIDAPFAVMRVLRAVRPDAFLAIETELWPNVLHLAHRYEACTFLVNGRVTDNLLQKAPRLGWIWRWMMGNLDGLLMRSHFDAERMGRLGAPASRLVVTGDVKLDAVPEASGSSTQKDEVRRRWRGVLGIAPDAPLWVAGSTHPGEEAMVLRTCAKLREQIPSLRVLIAPRHIERLDEVTAVVQSMSFSALRRTQLKNLEAGTELPADTVLVLDTVGELAEIYAAADVAFVGGSLIERGGHNVLEPVLRGVPVVFGPHMANFREAAALVQSARTGRMVQNEDELYAAVRDWLTDEAERQAVVQRAETALLEHRGAAQRVAALVAGMLEEERAKHTG